MPNVKEIVRVVNHIGEHLDELDMGAYGYKKTYNEDTDRMEPCGTRMCFAGFTLFLNTPVKKRNALFNKTTGHMKVGTNRKAMQILGLDEYSADTIFCGTATYPSTAKLQFAGLKQVIKTVLAGNYDIKINFNKAKSA